MTANAAAKAMSDDDFYSLFGDSTLLVTGSVASSKPTAGGTLVSFATSSAFGAACQVETARVDLKPGTAVTFVTQAEAANREPGSLLLTGCVQP
ncbi:MAG: hypothetical protein ACRENL_10925 [Candidatus Dormibacteria bacterium]